MDAAALLREKSQEILRLAEKHGASNVRLFASVGRGQADAQSDIDLLVAMEPGRSLLDHAALWLVVRQLLGCEVDVVSERCLKPRVREQVLREAVPL